MARFERTFRMQEGPKQAQVRLHELDATLHRIGFKPLVEEPGHIAWTARFYALTPILLLSALLLWAAIIFWVWRKMMKHRVEIDFAPDASGTKVTLTGRAGGGIPGMMNNLGCEGHWPENMVDRAWVPTPPDDRLAAWDDEAVDPQEMDRITRRALKKAGRLPLAPSCRTGANTGAHPSLGAENPR
jgi:hypothetical protein